MKLKVDFTDAVFPSDTILRTSEALKAAGRPLDASNYRRKCLAAWTAGDMGVITGLTRQVVRAE